jgi:formylglycine-generating enzyme required for sulfatase activity
MSTLTWLHLSDLHFRAGQRHTWDEDIVLRALLNDVREKIVTDQLRPDLIAVSGDIAFSGKAEEYMLAKQFFIELLKVTGLPREQLFIVPGNHDVDRKAVTRGAVAIASSLNSRQSLDEVLIADDDRRLIFRRFSGYADFVKDLLGEHLVFDDEHYSYAKQLNLAGQRFALLGLNSAWLSSDDNELGRLALGERQVRQALEASSDADLRIALLHHPLDWLREFDRNDCEDLLMEGCRFILHGHLHRTGLLSLKTPDARTMIIAAGACYDTRQYPNSYNWVQFDTETGRGTIYLRTYSDRRGGFWTKDAQTYKNVTDGEFTFALQGLKQKTVTPKAQVQQSAPPPPTSSEPDRQAALLRYLRELRRTCNALPLAALSEEADPHRRAEITLDRVYIALDTTTRLPLTEQEKRERAKRAPSFGREEERVLPMLEVAIQHNPLVILGDPGSGKSSFVNNLAFMLVGARLGIGALPENWTFGALLPVRVLLRELAPTLPREAELKRLSTEQRERALSDAVRAGIEKMLAAFDAGDAATLVRDALEQGKCLVILDGLDEVAPEHRRVTRDAVEAFAGRYAENRFLVTCRIRSYQSDARLSSFADVTLAPFADEKIGAFVVAWYNALAEVGQMPRDQAEKRTADLRDAVRRLQELACNPLLLTTMAVVHTAQVELPRERARLYQRCVEVLLRRWHKHKAGESPVLTELGLSESELMAALWQVAFEAHKRGKPGEAADLPRSLVLTILAARMNGDHAKAQHFLDHVDERAGLLVGRGGVDELVYTFPHRTFQEFLAGCHLALGERDFGRQLRMRLHEGDRWALAARLGAEHLLYNTNDKWSVLDALYALCPVAEPNTEADWRGVEWAGNITTEMGADKIRADTENPDGGPAFLQRLSPRLVALLERGLLTPTERAETGVALAKLGDPRPGVGVTPLLLGKGLEVRLPDFVWCEIPAGPFTMGTRKVDVPDLMKKYGGDKLWYERETPQHEEKSITRPYLIGKYLVTNAQFNAFVDAGGYRDVRYWQEALAQGRWNASRGQFKGRYDNEPRDRTYDFRSPFNLPNHPVVGVSWYEAVAFCRWLTERIQKSREAFRIQTGPVKDPNLKSEIANLEFIVSLPTEAEWEKAARGIDGGIFPWKGELTPQHANYADTNIGATSAVGIFPQGASPYGLLDVSGNVWEWCQTMWIDSYKDYAKQAKDRESFEGDAPRVLRGGSWYNYRDFVRAACRYRDGPDYGFNDIGFRVVVRPL